MEARRRFAFLARHRDETFAVKVAGRTSVYRVDAREKSVAKSLCTALERCYQEQRCIEEYANARGWRRRRRRRRIVQISVLNNVQSFQEPREYLNTLSDAPPCI